jgi:hypothetical protein
MVEWSGTADRLCGFGDGGRVALAAAGWEPGGDPPALGALVDAAVVGSVRGLRLPDEEAVLARSEDRPLPGGCLPAGTHEVVVDAALETRVAFEGPVSVEPGSEGTWLRFPEMAPVTVGFREPPTPRATMTVPATAAGLASAVTAAGRTHRTDGPERSHPGYRPRTPQVTFGADGTEATPPDDDRPTLTVPDRPMAVLVAAPLAYYLGAAVVTGGGPPTLRGDALEYTFEPLPGFADEAGDLLRRLCGLDVRVRSVPGESGPLAAPVEDSERLRGASPLERLGAVVESSFDPEETWPLATYVDDDVENGRYLPYLLDRLSLVHPAEASELDPQALLKRSLDEFFRGETASVETVDPALVDSGSHAWRGEGTPIDAFTLLGTGGDGLDDGFDIDVVCNDEAMRTEGSVAEVYRRRLAGRNLNVRVHERLTSSALSELFERQTDLVHFIGHCEVDGLVCPDGHLAAADLERCRAKSFFLNACGSYHEGYDLVRQGATVGGVTLTTVLDEQALTVGTAFAELLAAGFSFDRALSLARGEVISGRDYVVVGDGTHRLRPARGDAVVFDLERTDDGFVVGCDATAPDGAGRRYRDPFDGRERPCGVVTAATLTGSELRELFERYTSPVRYEGELRWTDWVAREVAGG